MRLDRFDSEVIYVVLSRRNVLALLAKASGYPADSLCTIYFPGTDYEPRLIVRVEPDDVHYANRHAPGPMVPETEDWIRQNGDASREH
jgi:hypothetical protein